MIERREQYQIPAPIQEGSIERPKPFPGISPKTIELLQKAEELGFYKELYPLQTQLINLYFFTETNVPNIAKYVHKAPKTVTKLIVSGLISLWDSLPSELKEQYSPEEFTRLKKRIRPRHSEETKGKIGEARRRDLSLSGPVFPSEETRKKISQSLKGKPSHFKGKHHLPDAKDTIAKKITTLWRERKAKKAQLVRLIKDRGTLNKDEMVLLTSALK